MALKYGVSSLLWEIALSVIIIPPLRMRGARILRYSGCSCFVASRKTRSNLRGASGIASGAWPRIWVILVRPEEAKVLVASGKRFFAFDSMV